MAGLGDTGFVIAGPDGTRARPGLKGGARVAPRNRIIRIQQESP